MTLFLTSSPCLDDVPQGVSLPCIFNPVNGFVDRLSECWTPDSNVLIIAADPDNADLNDEMAQTFCDCFLYHGLTIGDAALLDARCEEYAAELVAGADFILLGGGHVPTEKAFFDRIGLRDLLRGFDGVVMGVSAGSMNAADEVYAQPELEGESIDPEYERFIDGLGLTDLNILPHYQMVRDNILDGRRLYEDITFGDSAGRTFYVLPDGSYILQRDGQAQLCGEGYVIRDGRMRRICREGCVLSLGAHDKTGKDD